MIFGFDKVTVDSMFAAWKISVESQNSIVVGNFDFFLI